MLSWDLTACSAPRTQGKLDADKRAALIARGQELKDQLAAIESQLDKVRFMCMHEVGQAGVPSFADLANRSPSTCCLCNHACRLDAPRPTSIRATVSPHHAQVEVSLQREGQRLPNLTHPAVPIGGEEHAAVLREVGEPLIRVSAHVRT